MGHLVNQRVMLQGLATRADLNGCFGTCLAYDAGNGRYTVEVDEGRGQVALLASHVVAVPPPPPKRYNGAI